MRPQTEVTMDAKQKLRAVIEFLLLERHPGDEIPQRLHNLYGQDAYCRVSVV
jgi:hypothetical protein